MTSITLFDWRKRDGSWKFGELRSSFKIPNPDNTIGLRHDERLEKAKKLIVADKLGGVL